MRPRGLCHLVQAMVVAWLLSSSFVHGQDYGSESSSKESGTVSKFDNHLNASEGFLDSAELTSGYSQVDPVESPFYNNHQFHCQACQYRSVYAMASLKSIKAHVLMKLGIDLLPNRTRYPEVPQHILSSFLDQQNYQRPVSSLRDADYMEDDPSVGVEDPEEEYDYYPITNKIYILANQSQEPARRSSASDKKQYLQFQLETRDYTGDIQAKLMVYVHGEEWLKRNVRPGTFGGRLDGGGEVTFTVGKPGAGGKSGVIERFQQPVPKGSGHFVELNVTELVLEWFKERTGGSKYIVVETLNELARKLVVNNPSDSKFIPYIEIEFRDAPKKRIKRNLSLNCDENANETRCCRYPLTVDFEKFGWDWIIAPKRYEASYCAGECMLSFLPKYEHTHVMQLSTSAIPCCSPKKMSSIKLLYFDMSYNVIYSTIPNMVVEKCSCS